MEDFLATLPEWLESVYFGNTVQSYLVALAIPLAFWIFFRFLKNRIFKGLFFLAQKTKTNLGEGILTSIQYVPGPLYFFTALYISLQTLRVNELVMKIIEVILIVLAVFWATQIVVKVVEFVVNRVAEKKGLKKTEKTTASVVLVFGLKAILWTVGFLLILSNLNVDITALIASLGIGGIAVALATQNILGDMFSSVAIYLDRPFEVGDYIVVGQHAGTVKKIGLRSTRMQALQGEEIVISNKELTSARIQNYKRMKKRRIAFELALAPETPTKTLLKVPQIVQKIIENIPVTEFDRAHLRAFDVNYKFEVVYYIQTTKYKDYMDIQEKFNLEILETFKKEKIDLKGSKELV